jgi:D-erythrulose 1-phosphate 3-epimerase
LADWFAALGTNVGLIHVQQTDFQYDRHWDFMEPGRIDPAATAALQKAHGLGRTPVFLEVFYPFERDDASVLQGVKRSVLLKPAYA